MRGPRPILLAFAVFLLSQATFAQPSFDTKQRFVAALIEFLEAMPGSYGDEGPRLTASIDQMESGLRRWDSAVDAYQRATLSQLAGTAPPVAAAMRLPLGAMYLERGRANDAIREFDAASELDPARPDVQLFRVLANEAAHRPDGVVDAVRRALKLDPDDPVKAYLYLHHIGFKADDGAAVQALEVLAKTVEHDAGSGRSGSIAPFVRANLLDEPATRDPIFAPVRYGAAFAALGAGDYPDAIRRFREAVARDPLVADRAVQSDPVRRGIAALREGRVEAAIEALLDGSRGAPESAEVHRVLGAAYWIDAEPDKAIDQFRQAVRLGSGDERSRMMLADLLSDAKDFDKAEQALRETVTALPDSAQARWRLGRLYQRLQREGDARVEFERALSLKPVVGAARLHAAVARWYLRETNIASAVKGASEWVDADLNDAAAHKELGEALRTDGRDQEALTELLMAVWLDPSDAEAAHSIGQIYLAQEKFREAQVVLQRAVAERPKHAESRYALAMALMRGGNDAEGAQQMELARQLQADSLEKSRRAYELNLLKIDAALKTKEEKYQAAADVWRQVVMQEPQLASNHVSLGEALAKAGRHEDAAAAFAAAAKLSDDPAIHQSLAREYAALGRPEESARERQEYRRIAVERMIGR